MGVNLMLYDITDQLDGVDFAPATEHKEILQNVRCIIATIRKTVPLDRAFGIDTGFVDKPMVVAQAMFTSEIISALQKYEPRAVVESIDWSGSIDGILTPKVRISIND